MLKSKIHRATVTDCHLHYVGLITAGNRILATDADVATLLTFEPGLDFAIPAAVS